MMRIRCVSYKAEQKGVVALAESPSRIETCMMHACLPVSFQARGTMSASAPRSASLSHIADRILSNAEDNVAR